MIRRGRISLAVIGCYYGLAQVLVVFLAATAVDLAAPRVGVQAGIFVVILVCLVMICNITKALYCRVIVDVNGNIEVVNMYRKHLMAASDVQGAALKRVAGKQELAVVARLPQGRKVTCMAIGVSEVDDFRMAVFPWMAEPDGSDLN